MQQHEDQLPHSVLVVRRQKPYQLLTATVLDEDVPVLGGAYYVEDSPQETNIGASQFNNIFV